MGTLLVASPYDSRERDKVPTAAAEHVEDALRVAYAEFPNKSTWRSIADRIEILNDAAAIMGGD